jgi:ribosomal protein S18 acetylase RimI-like enzyme
MIWRAGSTSSRREAPAGSVRAAIEADLAQIAALFDAVIARGDSYPFEHALDGRAQRDYWFGPGVSSYVWDEGGRVLGVYKLVPNQAGRGGHVANASYLVAPEARGRGLGRRLGEDSLVRARDAGYRAMQFNFVVTTNAAAVRLWQSLGFTIIGTSPGAYRHAQLGFVDAYVMFRTL